MSPVLCALSPRRRSRFRLAGAVLLAAGSFGAARAVAHRGSHESAATVDHVVDGDTVDVRAGGRFARVRILQIDAPESSAYRFGHPDRCGAQATAFAHTLTRPGARVTLQYAGRDRTDRYGRSLAIVHLGGPGAVTWEQRMVAAGWARVYVVDGNTTPLLPVLRADARAARIHRRGVWRDCAGRFHDPGDRAR